MKHAWLPAIAALACGLGALGAGEAQDVAWHTDLDAATKLSVETERPLLIVFR